MGFAIGNPGGPGRPKRQTETGYLNVLMETCSLDSWREICARAVADAMAGNPTARAWLARYLLGAAEARAPRPVEVVVSNLLMTDEALDIAAKRLAKPKIAALDWPSFAESLEDARRLEAEAREAIIAANAIE